MFPESRDPADPDFPHPSNPREPPERPLATPALVFCRRCGEIATPVANCCPWCGYWVVGPRPAARPVARPVATAPEEDWHFERTLDDRATGWPVSTAATHPLVVVMVAYGLLLAGLLAVAFLAAVYEATTTEELSDWMVGAGIVSTLVTVVAWSLVRREAQQPVPLGTRTGTWLIALPVLALLLGLNIAFITVLRELLRPFGIPEGPRIELTFFTVLLICVQPAIVEELFFRQMVLGVFRRRVNKHLAVWLTALMFALAHLGQVFAMPYLFVAGGFFGYARVYGGLPLAMLLHFIHNFVVIAYDAWG
ncbi:MAG: CPBP family glutamic-type intramembrane protease [Gemmataceae bacterium]|nr:CPBP family glutamic-type intramembrane protease [Gemmata sp.]MDW8198186.1 CPBP family glutamic-type intramembrane protease [Gemmataceae bacterium]